MMYDDWHNGSGWGAWLAMCLMLLLFLGVIITLVMLVLRSQTRAPESTPAVPPPARDQAERMLDERFAHGEIEADEYVRRRDLLRST
jgi:putative membrane protein